MRRRVTVACLVILGAVLRFYRLGSESLWVDELITVELVRRYGAIDLVFAVPSTQPHLPLYYVMLDLWVGLVGSTPAAMRSLSAVVGVLSIPAVYVLGRELYGHTTGLLASAFVTLSRFQVDHAQQVRMYSLVLLLTTLSYYCFYSLDRRRGRWGYLPVSVALVTVHPFGVLAIASQFVAAGGRALRGEPPVRRHRLQFKLVGIALLSAVAGLLAMAPGRTNPWLAPPTPVSVLRTLFGFFVSGEPFVRALVVPIVPILCFAGFTAVFRRSGGSSHPVTAIIGDRERLLIAGVAVPLAVLIGVSYLVTPVFVRRYAMVVTPPLYLLIGRGLSRTGGRRLGIVLVVVLLLGMGAPTVEYHTGDQRQQWEEATAVIESRADADALVLVYDRIVTRNVDYYLDQDLRTVGVVAPDSGTGLAPTTNGTVREWVTGEDEVWIVFSNVDRAEQRRLSAVVGASHELTGCSEFVRVRVCEFEPRS